MGRGARVGRTRRGRPSSQRVPEQVRYEACRAVPEDHAHLCPCRGSVTRSPAARVGVCGNCRTVVRRGKQTSRRAAAKVLELRRDSTAVGRERHVRDGEAVRRADTAASGRLLCRAIEVRRAALTDGRRASEAALRREGAALPEAEAGGRVERVGRRVVRNVPAGRDSGWRMLRRPPTSKCARTSPSPGAAPA